MHSRPKPRKHIGRCESRKVCRSKYDAAQDLVKAANSRGCDSALSLIRSAYWCRQCDFWHLTRQVPWFRANDRTRHLIAPDVAMTKV
mgnify:CR=1 FL=1